MTSLGRYKYYKGYIALSETDLKERKFFLELSLWAKLLREVKIIPFPLGNYKPFSFLESLKESFPEGELLISSVEREGYLEKVILVIIM